MNLIAPKELFVKGHQDFAEAMTQFAGHPAVRHALVFSFAEMTLEGATEEQLAGAKRFAQILINMGEVAEPLPPFPDKSLKTI